MILVRPLSSQANSISGRVLKKIYENETQTPIEKGYNFLVNNCIARSCFQPHVSSSPQFTSAIRTPFFEVFDTTLILDLLIKKTFCPSTIESGLSYISKNQKEDKLFSFFEDSTLLPPDVDDTSLALLVLLKHKKRTLEEVNQIASKIIANVDNNGIIQTYFPPQFGREARIDPSVCANALRLIHYIGRGSECRATEDYLYNYLEKRTHLLTGDNLYYGNQTFFYFMGEAIKSSRDLRRRFGSLFIDRVIACIGSTKTPIDLATRVIVSNDFGFSNKMESEHLSCLQLPDGSWPIDIAYTGSRKNLYWGSKMISTAFALRALDNKKVFQTRKKMFSLPIFSIGLELSNGLLSYNKFFKIIKSRHEMVAITHTETPSGLLSKFYDPDPASLSNALTEKGQKDARALGYSLRAEFGEKPVVILHAKNTRTFQTALAIREQLPQAKMECANWLNEIYCSEWLGQDSGKVLQTNFTASSMFHHSNCLAHPKDGENFLEFLNKIYLGLKELQQRDVNDTTILLCTSRVNLVALKILTQRDIEYDSNTRIDWARMAHKSKAGTVFRFNHYPIEQTHRVNEKS